MPTPEIHYQRGIPEPLRRQAAQLYEAAFGPKFAVAIPTQAARIDLLAQSMQLDFAFGAIRGDQLVGLAGFHSEDGSLTGGMGYGQLIASLGLFRGNWAALVFSLYERRTTPGQLLMDGISVHPEMRGQGIGGRLLAELFAFAAQAGYATIRLDVIDTNPGARRLYERKGFVATKTDEFGYLRWLLGFGASTTMIRNSRDL